MKLIQLMPIRIKEIYYLKLLISLKTQNQKILVNKNKKDTLERLNALYKGREMALSAFKNRLFPLNPTEGISNPEMPARIPEVSDHSHIEISSPKQMLQRLPIAFVQLKAGNTSVKLFNKIC